MFDETRSSVLYDLVIVVHVKEPGLHERMKCGDIMQTSVISHRD